ncbi:pyridoxal phosphate-dependent aminotransferase [Streptomyces ureilyticus]|uniref:alanine transaminase n=1 Tax=Streptomyces ureilyticus TaxID=1775131 RepID=A0ABX0DV92_9ACTN|nr:pyridoxal phosphate-dependent aminotransferase [Streptomyces ureilyticus]NGO45816.1 pyridoxal phosphate-dependent aminotransferase [Streptomyces ureilyticus]
MEFKKSGRLTRVGYEIRGPMLEHADALETAGNPVMRLNTGDPAMFGLRAADNVLQDVIAHLPESQGYSAPQGIVPARLSVADYYARRGVPDVTADDVYLGNGVSELICMATQALLDDGDEVLIPAPDFPLWTAATTLASGKAVHYLCDEESDWYPDLADMTAKVTDRTRAVVLINPNNPTGAVYPRDVLEAVLDLARRHHLIVFADEIYDRIVYDDALHHCAAAIAPDVLCLTFSGLSKAYRLAGLRSGWLAISGPKQHAKDYLAGLSLLAAVRLCPNVPAQHAIRIALDADHSIDDLVLPAGRLAEQRDLAWELLNAIPGVSCVKPKGALYAFPRLEPTVYPVEDDGQLAFDLLREEKVLVVRGTGFNWPRPDHFRLLTLPGADDLTTAITRIGHFLGRYHK